MRRIACIFWAYCLAYLPVAAQESPLQIITEFKTGYSSMQTAAFRQWAMTERVYNATGRADNIQMGFAFEVVVNRKVFNMSLDFDAGSRKFIKPHASLWFLGGGYQVWHSRTIDINLIGNLGIGDIKTRFREHQPASFISLPYSGKGAFARSIVLVGQPMLCFNIKPAKPQNGLIDNSDTDGIRMLYSLKVGFDVPLVNGRWKYGQTYRTQSSSSNNSNATVFRGSYVNMPNFYKGAFFIQFGVGFLIETH